MHELALSTCVRRDTILQEKKQYLLHQSDSFHRKEVGALMFTKHIFRLLNMNHQLLM